VAAERIRRGRDDDEPAVVHGLELTAQQQRLLARFPGVRHLRGRRLVVAGKAPSGCRCRAPAPALSYDRRAPSASVTERACASTAVAVARAMTIPRRDALVRELLRGQLSQATITALLNGQAVNVAFASTSVTAMRGSAWRRARAQLAPAKPPPTTTTRAAAPGRRWTGKGAAEAVAATRASKTRGGSTSLLRGVPGGDRLDLLVGEALAIRSMTVPARVPSESPASP